MKHLSNLSNIKIARYDSCQKYNKVIYSTNKCKFKSNENRFLTIGKKILLLASAIVFSPILILMQIDYDLEETSNKYHRA